MRTLTPEASPRSNTSAGRRAKMPLVTTPAMSFRSASSRRRVEQRQAVAVEHHVAVVGLEVLAQLRVGAALQHLAADVAARHRDHLDRQRELAQHRHQLRGVADADELPRHRGDDLLARERAAAALDHVQVLGDLVGAVDVHRQLVDAVQVEDADAVLLQPLGARFRGGHRAFDAALDGGERVDEEVHRRAGADADHGVLDDVLERLAARPAASARPGSFLSLWRQIGAHALRRPRRRSRPTR